MIYAVISDIHGNYPALKAVTYDAKAKGAEAFLLLGDYIRDTPTLNEVVAAAGYSKYHIILMFREVTGKTPVETIRALRLTKAAQTLHSCSEKIVDVVMGSGFDSHDGFPRAFTRQFGITPQKYHVETPPVRWFVHNPIEAYYILKEGRGPIDKRTN